MNGQDKKKTKTLGEYFGFKSKDADDAIEALRNAREMQHIARQDSARVADAERTQAWGIEKILMKKMREEQYDMEKRHYYEQETAALKDPRYERGLYKDSTRGFTEANPDTLRERFSKEQGDLEMTLMQLLGRTQESDPNRNIYRAKTAETLPFIEHLKQMDEPTLRILQMIIDEEKQVNKKVDPNLMVPGLSD